MLLSLLAGCQLFELITNVQETVEDLTNPVVIQATFIGVGEPPEGFEFPDDADIGPVISAVLADAESSSDLAESPVQGATATIQIGSGTPVPMAESTEPEAGGAYRADAEDGLTYTIGQTALLKIETETVQASASWVLPAGLDFEVPCRLESQEDLTVVMDSLDYHSPLVVVIDESGTVTWTNSPSDINAAVDWVNGGGFASVAIPGGEAFAADGPYFIGIAPVQRASTDAFEGVNVSLSAYMVGQMRFWVTTVGALGDTGSEVLPELGDTACLEP